MIAKFLGTAGIAIILANILNTIGSLDQTTGIILVWVVLCFWWFAFIAEESDGA